MRDFTAEKRAFVLPEDEKAAEQIRKTASNGPLSRVSAVDFACAMRCPHHANGNTVRMLLRFRDELRRTAGAGWYVWDGKRWRHDETSSRASKIADEVAWALDIEPEVIRAAYAIGLLTETESGQAEKHVASKEAWARKTHESPVILKRAAPYFTIEDRELDRRHDLAVVENGTLNLVTGEMRDHRRDDLMTRLIPIEYDASAKCPTWERALDQIFQGDRQVIDFVQRAFGYSLTGHTNENKMFIADGGGSNGKSLVLSTLRKIAGDYGDAISHGVFLSKGDSSVKEGSGHTEDEASVAGLRVGVIAETPKNIRLAEDRVKRWTGDTDTFKARRPYGLSFTIEPIMKPWLGTNYLPKISGVDNGIWRRILRIRFNAHFANPGDRGYQPGVSLPKDRLLAEKIEAELPGILAWAVRGAIAWKTGGLQPPQSVILAGEEYEEDSDALRDWLDICCERDNEAWERAGVLRASYECFLEKNAGGRPMSETAFGRALTERNLEKRRRAAGIFYRGLKLTDAGRAYADGMNPAAAQSAAPAKSEAYCVRRPGRPDEMVSGSIHALPSDAREAVTKKYVSIAPGRAVDFPGGSVMRVR